MAKKDRKQLQAEVNALLKAEADELKLGRKSSLKHLASLRSDQVAYSARAKLEFREYVRRQLEKRGTLAKNILQAEGARLIGVSPVTTKRYMDEMRTGLNAPFAGLGDSVIINPDYVPPEEDDYWADDEDDDVPEFVGRRSA